MNLNEQPEDTMSEAELIVAALAAGASAGATNTTSAAIHDAYQGLKGLLRRRLGDRPTAGAALATDETEAGAWKARIGGALLESGASADEEILAAARELLTLTNKAAKYVVDIHDARGVQIGDRNTQNNTFT